MLLWRCTVTALWNSAVTQIYHWPCKTFPCRVENSKSTRANLSLIGSLLPYLDTPRSQKYKVCLGTSLNFPGINFPQEISKVSAHALTRESTKCILRPVAVTMILDGVHEVSSNITITRLLKLESRVPTILL